MDNEEHRSISDAVEGTSQADFRARDWGQLGLAAFIFGSSFLFITLSLRSFSSGTVAFGKAALGAAALAIVPAARCSIRRTDWSRLVLASLLGMALPTILFTIAQERIPSALAGMLVSATAIFTAVVAAVETRTLPRSTRLVGLLVGFAGIVLLSAPNLTGLDAEALGVVLVLVAVLGHSVATTIYAPLQQTYGSMSVALWLVAVSAVLLAPFGFFGLTDSTFELTSFVALLILGVIGTGLVWAVYLGVIGRVGAVRASVAGYIIPIVALVLGVLILSERVEIVQVVGVVVALAGGYILSKGKATTPPVADAKAGQSGTHPEIFVSLDGSCRTMERDLVAIRKTQSPEGRP